ncbi:Trafficking protein particle complex subunit 8 [Phytophthora citrophthora]|uniref:Trafficking protein particle complex subunit 8 n=1 Tax=Phytophthora citrophthora TaxID=4793 RepID=A0AAD9LT71_9STRA|nr:Trafficking protein particle complex subunit 8 [Phytophthora citrophthora]
MESFESWVQDTFAPVVLTCSTSEAERIAQKNNLSVADLLNGFSRLEDADTPLRSVTHPIQLARFNFRFLSASQFHTLGVNEATEQLNASIKRYPPQHNAAAASAVELDIPRVTNVDDVPTYLRVIGADPDAEGNDDPMPWYRSFKHTLMDTFRCEEYSLLCHPVAMLVVVSSTDPNPRHSFEELTAPKYLPAPFQMGLYDAMLVPKFYVVLHDVLETEGTSIDPDAILRSMNITTVNGTVLRINSLPVEDAPVPSQFATEWTENPYVRPPLFPHEMETFPQVSDGVGTLLSRDDVAQIRAFVRDFGLRFMLSSLEGRIFQLNEVVSAMKKGVKNVFKSWLRKPKDLRPSNTSSSGAVIYKCDSIESQTRLLADTAFLVRDYELALQMYRLVRDDFKSDKSVFHCGNVNEMIALCLLLTKGSPMQMTNALDSANAIYAKTPSPLTQRLAIRTAVLAGEIYHTLSKSGLFTDYMDNASAALIRGSTMEQGICAAVLMERAALCDLRARLPKFRKYGFRMVMAGHVYDSLGHEQHSARCYSLARAIYDCSGWFLVEDHINFMLAQQANKLDDRMASINLFLKLIGTGRNSASQQEAMLYDFGLMVKDFLATERAEMSPSFSRGGPILIKNGDGSAKKLLVRDLCMPELDDKSTVVFASTNAFGVDRSIDGNLLEMDMWRELGEMADKQNRLHQYVTSGNNNEVKSWFAPSHLYAGYRSKKNASLQNPDNYVLGEQIYVEFVMKNALSCAVDVEDIHLFGKFEITGENGETFGVPESMDTGEQRIEINSVNLQLLPCSEERVRLAVCPRICGKLSLTGVRWSICGGDVQGEHAFDIPGPLLQDTRANREARARAPNMCLIANVVESMPWLGVKVDGAPTEAFVGEVMKLNVSLVNSGTASLGGLQVCCTDLLLCASGTDSADELCGYVGANGHVVELSEVILAPGESREVTIWARGASPGRRHSALLFRYKTATVDGEANTTSSLSRTVKIKLDLDLLPCIDVSYSIEPSFGSSGEYIVGITVSNQRGDHDDMTGPMDGLVRLEELLCVSNSWAVEKLARAPSQNPVEMRDSLRLGFFEASTSYFRVVRRPDITQDTSQLCKLPLSPGQNSSELSTSLPILQFLCLENAGELVRAGGSGNGEGNDSKRGGGFRTIQSVRRENKALKNAAGEDDNDQKPQQEPQPTSKDALLSQVDTDGHLVLVWSTDSHVSYSEKAAGASPRRAIGQANLTSVKIRPPPQEASCPLTVTLSYNDAVELRRPTSRLSIAELDIMMQICNDSAPTSAPLDVTVEMLHPEEVQASLPTSLPLTKLHSVSYSGASPPQGAPPRFFWSGVTKKKVARFSPNSKVTINLKACFMAPGIYNLNRFRFVVHAATSGQPASVFMLPVEHLVYVKDSQAAGPLLQSETKEAIGELLVPVP